MFLNVNVMIEKSQNHLELVWNEILELDFSRLIVSEIEDVYSWKQSLRVNCAEKCFLVGHNLEFYI